MQPTTRQTPTKTALIVGATGNIGSEVATALLRRGWKVRGLSRRATEVAKSHARLGPVEWITGDAMNPADVIAAADGVSVIVHAAHPPGYRNWQGLSMPMLESTIAAAEASGARIVFPGTIYNYGPDAFPVLAEDSPQNPLTRKGRVRVDLEKRLASAADDGVRTLIVRAGDFFGPTIGNNWFTDGIIRPGPGRPVRAAWNPARRPGVGHGWAYLPDLAETIARLIERERDLARFDVFHFRGHQLADAVEMPQAVARVVGNPRLPIRRFPWWAIALASPFVTLAYEMREMRYLWKEPLELDNTKLVAFLGEEPHTPLDAAVAATLAGLGCLEAASTPGLAERAAV